MLITMSDKEIQRLAVLQDVKDHRITQVRAAEWCFRYGTLAMMTF